MSQQSDEYSFLVARLLDLLTEQYGFREHWEVTIANNIYTENVSITLTLRQTPGRHRYGDVQMGFWIAKYMFTEFAIIRGRVIEAANAILNGLQYRNRQDSHPPQVKIYCWLEENSLESQEPPFGSSVYLHVLIQDLLRVALGASVRVYSREVRIADRVFQSPRELSHAIEYLLTQRQLQSTPTVSSQHRSHIRRVEL